MKNARLCMMTLATVTALFSVQAMAAETLELQGEQLASAMPRDAVSFNGAYLLLSTPRDQKMGPDIAEISSVYHCFNNPTGHGSFKLEIEAAFTIDRDTLPSGAAYVAAHVEDPSQTVRIPKPKDPSPLAWNPPPWAAVEFDRRENSSTVHASLAIDANDDGQFHNHVIALDEVSNAPKNVCMTLDFSESLKAVGIRSIRLVPVR